ncbi:TPA: hypothetical protein SMR48_004969 [Pseudomonas putida]|nr:hypothetical protein [Pseudomonas putida]HEK1693663.1 hypothetical protein [Pseudomonas putida]
MQVSSLNARTPFAQCTQTSIQDDLLEALIRNKRGTKKYKGINPIIANGHGRLSEARQILTFLMRRALGIFRIPGTYDLPLMSEYFANLSIAEIDGACKDIKRIYDHSQSQMCRFDSTINLVRGIGGLEASACKKLLDEIPGAEIPFYFQSITFFNHVCGGFSRNISLNIDCPVEWVWASAYTLKDLELPGSDEEVMVVCRALDGVLNVPKQNFQITPSPQPLEPLPLLRGYSKKTPKRLPEALSFLMQEGFEPNKYAGHAASYRPGKWEARLARLGRRVDSIINPHSRSTVEIDTLDKH